MRAASDKWLGVSGGHYLSLLAACEGAYFEHPQQLPPAPVIPHRSRHLEEEQQVALATLSRQLEAITDVEELTKLVSVPVLGASVCQGRPCVCWG